MGSIAEPVVACGHTHIPRIVRSRRGQLLVSPGSVGLQAYQEGRVLIESGTPDSRYAIVERRNGAWGSQLLAVPYDHASMAALAKRR